MAALTVKQRIETKSSTLSSQTMPNVSIVTESLECLLFRLAHFLFPLCITVDQKPNPNSTTRYQPKNAVQGLLARVTLDRLVAGDRGNRRRSHDD